MNVLKPVLGSRWMQALLKKRVDKQVNGPDEATRHRLPSYVWGEAQNAKGQVVTVRIKTANGYSLTVDGALTITMWLMHNTVAGGSYTPAMLLGAHFIETLPGSGTFIID